MKKLESLAASIFGLAFLVLAIAVTIETIMRKAFNQSLQGVDELGGYILALAGALTAPKISMQPGLSSDVIILSFAIVVIGGVGSVEGAAIGAVLVGLARATSVHLMPQAELFMIYLIMAAVLMFRPEGLFKRETARRI